MFKKKKKATTNSSKLKLGQACRASSRDHDASSVTPDRKRPYLHLLTGRCLYITIHQGEENIFPLHDGPANQTVEAQPMRSHHTLDSWLLPMDSLVITAPLNSLLFPIKASSFSLCSGFAYGVLSFTYTKLEFLCYQ